MMTEANVEATNILGKTLGRVITPAEVAQVSGGVWWAGNEPTVDNYHGVFYIQNDKIETWVY